MKVIVAFRNFANASKKRLISSYVNYAVEEATENKGKISPLQRFDPRTFQLLATLR
jgi:hypothetical protein